MKTDYLKELDVMRELLCAAIADDPEPAFPNMEWRRKGAKWVSPYHVNGGVWGNRDRGGNVTQTMLGDHVVSDAASGEQPTETIVFWFNNNPQFDYNNPVEGFNELARRYSIAPIEQDPEQAKKAQERKTETEQLLADIRAAFMGPEGEQVRAYLSAPIEQGGRGYDAATVEAMADYIGVVTPTTGERLAKITGLPIPKAAPKVWPIVIWTQRKGDGALQYVKFRCLFEPTPYTDKDGRQRNGTKWHNPTSTPPEPDKANKYWFYPSAQGVIGKNDADLYNYNQTAFLATGARRTAVIVESELCAAHATIAGIKNVIALRGLKGLTPAAASRLVRDKCERVVILTDSDEAGREGAANLILEFRKYAQSLRLYVAETPNAKDPDELLATDPTNGPSILQRVIDNAEPATSWEACREAHRYNNAENTVEREQIKCDVINKVAEIYASGMYTEADNMASAFREYANVKFTAESLSKAAADKAHARAMEQYEKRQREAFEKLDAARRSNDEHATREAVELLADMRPPRQDAETVGGQNLNDVLVDLYNDPSLDIVTSYKLYTKKRDQLAAVPLKLYSKGITYIAGGTSHGKSTFLQNIAFDLLRNGRRVLYYSFEETKRSTLLEFINIYIHKQLNNKVWELSDDNNAAINEYFKDQNPSAFAALSPKDQQTAADAVRSFFANFRGVGTGHEPTLFVYDDPMTSAELVDDVAYKAAIIRPDAIFIDYVQFLDADRDNRRSQQFEELGRVSKDLVTINKMAGVPVVCAAQLKEKNNEKSDPFEYKYTDIWGASSIAQDAAAVYLVGNSTKFSEGTTVNYFDGTKNDDKKIFTQFGGKGLMAVKLDKCRFGACPAFALYAYDGGQRYIEPSSLKTPTAHSTKLDNVENKPVF